MVFIYLNEATNVGWYGTYTNTCSYGKFVWFKLSASEEDKTMENGDLKLRIKINMQLYLKMQFFGICWFNG